MVRTFVLALTISLALSSCVGNSQSPPTIPGPMRWQLTGMVRSDGAPLPGAVVQILDGANKDSAVGTDASGRYTFPTLIQGGFTARALAIGYTSSEKPINLVSNVTQDFEITKILVAVLQAVAEGVVAQQQADGTFTFQIPAINTGDGCAGSISGRTALTAPSGDVVAVKNWALAPATIVAPGQRFVYSVAGFTRDEAAAAVAYTTRFDFVTVPCP